jgi:hypothetical protein
MPGSSRPEGVPVGYLPHEWVAALTVAVGAEEVLHFQKKADSAMTKHPTTGRVQVVDRLADVLDVYCRRCGARPGREEWCPRDPLRKALR